MIGRTLAIGLVLLGLGVWAAPAQAAFGVDSFDAEMVGSSGGTFSSAGGHPFEASFTVRINSHPDFGVPFPDGELRAAQIALPAGFVGDPTAVPRCAAAEFYGTQAACPDSSVVGYFVFNGDNSSVDPPVFAPIYNLQSAPGMPALLGLVLPGAGQPLLLTTGVRTGGDYGIDSGLDNIPQTLPMYGGDVVLWGVPADPAHDSMRGDCLGPYGESIGDCPSDVAERPFLTMPTSCSGPLETEVFVRSWEDETDTSSVFSDDAGGNPIGLDGCASVPFQPSVEIKATTTQADSPTGVEVEIGVPQNNDADGIATAHLRDAVVELPEGMAVNPAVAGGLQACSEAQIGLDDAGPARCPDASKLGRVEIETPLLDETLTGSVYQAEQGNLPGHGSNPFDSLVALYIVAEGERSGVRVKLAGEVETDPETGRLTARFTDNPQLPFETLTLRLPGGERAPLVTPPTCGVHEAEATLTPWSAPASGSPEQRTDTIAITSGPGGGPCSETLADRPFDLGFAAGVMNPVAGSKSPFVMRLTRPDGNQEVSSLTVTPPPGVTAKLKGTEECSEAGVAAGDCPATSKIGTSIAGAGAGPNPYYVQGGSVYLAGPYKGAPLSLLISVPAIAGPFDLGEVNVRAAVHVDPRTARLRIVSDPIPRILEGIPLRVRDLRVAVDKPDFTIAPTSCDPMSVGATAHGSQGGVDQLSSRFQVAGCGDLGFDPKLRLSFGKAKRNTKPNAHPPLNANLSFNEGDSNISSVEVALPQGLLLDQERLGRICSRANYAAETCPRESQVGYAKATTPLLADPVEGPVYLKASDNTLPDLAADLDGQIDIDLFGRIDQKQNRKGLNQIRNTFDVVPDVPVSDFELTLEGGSDGLLVNSRNICKSKKAQRVSIDMVAHNEMTSSSRALIGSACKQLNSKKAKRLKAKAKKLLRKAKKAGNPRKAKKLRKQARKLKRQARKLGR